MKEPKPNQNALHFKSAFSIFDAILHIGVNLAQEELDLFGIFHNKQQYPENDKNNNRYLSSYIRCGHIQNVFR